MNTSLSFYENKVQLFDYASRFNFFSKRQAPYISMVFLIVTIRSFSENTIKLLESYSFVEWVSGRRPFLKKVGLITIKNRTMFNVLIVVTLRKDIAFEFFLYLNICLSVLGQKLLKTRLHLGGFACAFLIGDPAFFIGMPDFFYRYNVILRVKCQLGVSHLNLKQKDSSLTFLTAQFFSQFSGFREWL